VSVVPHIPLEVIDRIDRAAELAKADLVITEIAARSANTRTFFSSKRFA